MGKKLYYMVVDTETATLPFANDIAMGDSERKKKIAIARPLVYDFGYTIMARNGEIITRKHWLIAETFAVPAVFNTAYYAEKRPIYLDMLKKGEISICPWNDVMDEFITDLEKVDFVGAYNSAFDFKKAIPFTELYISKLYSPNYYEWEKIQYKLCEKIAAEPYKKNPEKIFDAEHFSFRGKDYELFDIWGMACDTLLNKKGYKEMCLNGGMLSNTGDFFKTSAETSYRYLCDKFDFEEAHTALADAEIESFILAKILKKQAVEIGISFFPFRKLGSPCDFVLEQKKINVEHVRIVYEKMYAYVGDVEPDEMSQYKKRIAAKMYALAEYLDS